MKKAFFNILLSNTLRRIVNPNYNKITKVEEGNICIVLSASNRLGDLVIHNFLVQQLLVHGFTTSYALSSSYFNRFEFFFKKHSETKKILVLPNSKFQWIQFIFKIRRENIKAVILDEYPLISSIFFYLAGVPVIIGPKGENSIYYTKEYQLDKLNIHYTDLVYSLMELLNKDRKERMTHAVFPFFPFDFTDLKELRDDRGTFLVIHLGGSNHWNRKWPINKYIEICELFLKHYEGKIFLIGGKDEFLENEKVKAILEDKYKGEERIINFCGADLDTTATVISSSALFIGNDSGPLHIANALNKRVIGIYGPSPIAVFNPTKYNEQNVTVYADLPCVPCCSPNCKLSEDKKFSCLTDLSTEIVWGKAKNLLNV